MSIWTNVPGGTDPMDFNEETSADRMGRRIRDVRTARGLSQTEFGELIGLNANRVQQYENGARKPKPDLLKKMAEALGVSTLALTDPIVSNYIGVMYSFFDMEEAHDLHIMEENGRIKLMFGDGRVESTMNSYLEEWLERSVLLEKEKALATSDSEKKALETEYRFWKWNYPRCLADQTSKEERKAQIQEKIEQLQQALSELDDNK